MKQHAADVRKHFKFFRHIINSGSDGKCFRSFPAKEGNAFRDDFTYHLYMTYAKLLECLSPFLHLVVMVKSETSADVTRGWSPYICAEKAAVAEREISISELLSPYYKQHPDPSTGLNESVIEFRATPMRVDENYSFYYVNLTRLIVTGIVPFGALAMLNFSIYRYG